MTRDLIQSFNKVTALITFVMELIKEPIDKLMMTFVTIAAVQVILCYSNPTQVTAKIDTYIGIQFTKFMKKNKSQLFFVGIK